MLENILVTGSKGQLGSEFKKIGDYNKSFKFFFEDLELDISNKKLLEEYIKANKINIIINTAAYTDVNKAEIEKEKANLINCLAVKNLVELSEKFNCKLIHFSTDYVYNGKDFNPIKENISICPINYYGRTKRNGELFIENSHSESIIIRTSWLYSFYGNNFVNTIIEKSKKEKTINVVSDQYGCPTYARDLALTTIHILDSKLKLDYNGKIYNYSNLGSTNWSTFAKEIVKILNLDCEIRDCSSSLLKTNLRRPKFAITSKNKIISNFKINIPVWKKSLKNYLNNYYL